MEAKRKRGPYKRYLLDPTAPVPRQTRFNWRCTGSPCLAATIDRDSSATLTSNSEDERDSTYAGTSDAMELQLQPRTSESSDSGDNHYSSSDTNIECESDGEAWADVEPDRSSSTHQPLFPGAQIDEETGSMLILSLASKHRLTHYAISDIMQVVTMHLPQGTKPKFYR